MAVSLFLVVAVVTAPDPGEDRARAIGSQIRCPVCQGESIAESPSQTARDMMDLVRQRIDEGLTDRQIIDELLTSYSGALLLDPPLGGTTLWLWLAPIAAIGIGVVLIGRRFRVRRHAETDFGTSGPPGGSSVGSGDKAGDIPPVVDARFGQRRRVVIGGVGLALTAAITLGVVGQYRQTRDDRGLLSGVAGGSIDPTSISNETMEAVIAANLDNPDISGMRLALANRYFDEGEYQKAFPHYESILQSNPTPAQAAATYTRLGWMVFDGNGEVDLALSLIDRALEAVPGDPFATYLKGRVVWCGQKDPVGAAELFSQVLAASQLDAEIRAKVEADLSAAASGSACQ